jgi:hypothetical protein
MERIDLPAVFQRDQESEHLQQSPETAIQGREMRSAKQIHEFSREQLRRKELATL